MKKHKFRVNVITENHDWILKRAATELSKLDFVSINQKEGVADIDYYMPYLGLKQVRSHKNIKLSLFTHVEAPVDDNTKKKYEAFKQVQLKTNYAIALSKKTYDSLNEDIQTRTKIIHLGTDIRKKDILFGVCGKVHASGRKNEHFIRKLIAEGVNIISWGDDWGCKVFSTQVNHLPQFYQLIDYLIIPSRIEGGPVPVLEAIAMGKPVIAPDVGWCWDYSVIRYECNNYASLRNTINGLLPKNILSWEEWRQKHVSFFEEILNDRSQQINRS